MGMGWKLGALKVLALFVLAGCVPSTSIRSVPQLSEALAQSDQQIGASTPQTTTLPSDGSTWTKRASGVKADLRDVAYGNNTFVAVGDLGTILTSPDGLAWRKRSVPNLIDYSFRIITYGNGLFVAANSYVIATSPNGGGWTIRGNPNAHLKSATYGNGVFILVGSYDSGVALLSPDGVKWERFSLPSLVLEMGFLLELITSA